MCTFILLPSETRRRLESDVLSVVSYLTFVLGTKCWSYERAVRVLSIWDILCATEYAFLGGCGILYTVFYLTETGGWVGFESGVDSWFLPSSFCFVILREVERCVTCSIAIGWPTLVTKPFPSWWMMSPETMSPDKTPSCH